MCELFVNTLKGYAERDAHHNYTIAKIWKGNACDPAESLFADAKRLPISNIKICLSSGTSGIVHEGSFREAFDGTPLLETIILEIGPVVRADYDHGLEDKWFPQLCFNLSVPRSQSPVTIAGFRIGRYDTHQDLGAESNFALAREWLSECKNSHFSCLADTCPELPNRVIDVGLDDTPVKLFTSNGTRAEYVALSHCWGGPITPLLTQATVECFQERLPYGELPANFQDAITITRAIGIRYLWIDSLCIIQDCTTDWEQESKNMGSIYRNSTITLSALASANSRSGILRGKTDINSDEFRSMKIKTFGNEEDDQRIVQIKRLDCFEETLTSLDVFGPLAQRAWTLQETLLSPRQLYFGLRQIYWRCPHGYCSADGYSRGDTLPYYRFERISEILHKSLLRPQTTGPAADIDSILREYYLIVEQYSTRGLTYATDKLPAFSGVSSQLQHVIGGTYIAGLWSDHVTTGLLWSTRGQGCRHVLSYRAPSWSWAAIDGGVHHTNLSPINKKIPSEPYLSTMRLLDHQVTLKDETNPYGEILFASLVVHALTLPFVRSEQIFTYLMYNRNYGFAKLDEDPHKYSISRNTGISDRAVEPKAFRENDCTELALFNVERNGSPFLLAMSRTFRNDTDRVASQIDFDAFTDEQYVAMIVYLDESDHGNGHAGHAEGLILRPIAGSSTSDTARYERVGRFGISRVQRERLQDWSWQTLTLV